MTKEIAYVVDTNALYRNQQQILDLIQQGYKLVITGAVVREIDKHKTSDNPQLAFLSRTTARFIKENLDNLILDLRDYNAEWVLGHEYSNEYADNRIVACAKNHGGLISNDLNVQFKGRGLDLDVIDFGNDITEVEDDYKGFIEVSMSKESFQEFYDNRLHLNEFNLLQNQYLIVNDKATQEPIESFRWDGALYVPISRKALKSMFVDDFEAWDEFQACAIDAAMNHSIIKFSGAAGTAKTQIAISYGLQQLQAEKINKIIIFSNTIPTKGAFYHGLVKGDLKQKLFSSSIGHILMSKLGSYEEIESLMVSERLLILPASDIRGFDSNGMNALIIITEAQNWHDELMKLAIQRKGKDCKMIIEGDNKTQIDLDIYTGARNGMRRVSEVFRGKHMYAEVELQKIYRSEEAEIAELMTQY